MSTFFDKRFDLLLDSKVSNEKISDQEVVGLVLAGEKEQFVLLMQRYERIILGYVLPMLNYHRQDTEDICSEVWIKAYKKLGSYKPKYKFLSWIYQIARNVCVDHLRRHGRQAISIDLQETSPQQIPLKEDGKPFDTNDLNQILSKLQPRDREILILRYLQGFSVSEIGEIHKLKPSQVSVRLTRARDRAQKIVRQYYPQI